MSVSNVTASAASIHWNTDRSSNSRVEYGLTPSFGSSSTNPTLVTSHTVVIAGLASSTLYYYRVHSEDAAGNPTVSARFTFTTAAAPDTTRPTAAITAPAAGASVSGSIVVTAAASDNVGVAGVQFKLDGSNLGAEDTTAPYSITWTTTATSNGGHTLSAVARDAAGNTTTSAAVGVTVANDVTPPAISSIAAGSITASSAAISWATNEASNSQVDYGPTSSYGSATALNGTMVTAHAATISGLSAGTLYHFRVKSRDAAGNLASSGDFTFTTLPAADVTAPAVAVTAPGPGATISGSVNVSAAASDNVGVAGVQFRLNGTPVGAEDATAPYSVSWDTTGAANGTHVLTAVARDAAGNTTTSAAVTVTVANTAATVLTLSPQDTSIKLDATNYSADTTLIAYTWPDQRVANAILMKFDLSSLPAGGVVQQATLHVAVVDSDAAVEPTYSVAAHKVLGRNPAIGAVTGYTADGITAWTPNTCCNNGVPMAQADISAAYDTQALAKPPGFSSWTITTMVQEWLASPGTNFGLLLNPDATRLADRYRTFASMEHAEPALRPYLRVSYTIPPPDTTAPTVSITAPGPGSTVSGTVTVSVNASDNVGVAGVQFKLDGVNLGAEDTTAPYSIAWTTTATANGGHTLSAVARDAAGNAATAAAVGVTVANDTTAPAISSVAAASITASGATISWTTNEAGNSQVDYGTTASYGSATPLNGTMVTAHAATLSGLSAGTLYHFRVKSRDAAGNLASSGDFTFTTLAAADATAPTVAVTAPGAGATISGSVNVSAAASDNVGVAGVQFRLDGAPLGVEDTSAPYSVSWNTGSATNGPHTLTAVARDAAGNTATSAAISVTVSNTVSTVVTLSPQDTSIKLDATNYSAGTMLTTYTWPDQRVANAILMKFDLSTLPAGAVVQNATLHLALVESDTTAQPTYAVSAHKVLGRNPNIGTATGYTIDGATGWTANACCSNGVPLAQADISAAHETRAVGKTLAFEAWTITAMVEEWRQDPSTNFGVLLNSDAAAAADRYRFFASMEHADPALRPYLRVTYAIPPPDTTPPAVSISAPAAGSTVSGTVTVTATASDNVGVASVQFELDGANLGARDMTAPFAIAWNTTTAAPGSHTLRAVARDAAGNATTSAAITVTVAAPPVSTSWPNEPAGFTVIEETGWESGTLGNWYRIFTSADKPINVGNISNSLIGESKALQIDFPAGHQGGGGTELRYDIASANRRTELYVGYYVQVNSQWQGHSSGINKMLYLHDGGGSFSAMWYEMFGSGGGALDLYVVNQSGNSPAGFHENVNQVTFTRGQWHKVEIYQRQGASNDGIVRVWVNGVLAIDRSDVNTRSTPIDNVTISGIWGGVGDSKNQADYMRFDRIRISRPQ